MKPISYSHVFVIESLRHTDVKTGTILFNDIIGRRMESRGHGNNARFIEVTDKAGFIKAMEEIRQVETKEIANPIIHFEMHGDEDGLELSNGEKVSWPELHFELLQVNGICRNNLFVSMATCRGANIHKLIKPTSEVAPLFCKDCIVISSTSFNAPSVNMEHLSASSEKLCIGYLCVSSFCMP